MSDSKQHIQEYLNTLRAVIDELSVDQVAAVIDLFLRAYQNDKTIFVCGNGGSWSTASHWVCDFSKGTVSAGAKRLKMYSLCDNISMLTAYGNDVSYEAVFSEPVNTYVGKDDIVVMITASGNSPNILAAANAAKNRGAITVGLIGFGGGKLASLVDFQITVNCREYGPVEDLHLVLDHIISLYLRKVIAGSAK